MITAHSVYWFWWAVSHEGVKQWCREAITEENVREFLRWLIAAGE